MFLRQSVVDESNIAIGMKFVQPLQARHPGDLLVAVRANHNVQSINLLPSFLDQISMPMMGRIKLSNNQSGFHGAGM